ncbi:unnamed protein product [Darwinula stevensoni]|uniref:Uncharacterized protein n=1 Tax=Darwinula stevensoni TaxID=69355 RepID=A0A7R8X6Z9_9CRUS|nr:unnamed protein product [Darwinula stevensoni]CAG0879992.1 unnamed protein product [Darwinula stevensoni]
MEQQNEISSSIVEQVEDGSEESSETSLIEKSSKQDERGHRAELDLQDLGFSEYFDPMSSGNFSDGSNPEEEAPTEQTILLKRIMSWGMHSNTSEGESFRSLPSVAAKSPNLDLESITYNYDTLLDQGRKRKVIENEFIGVTEADGKSQPQHNQVQVSWKSKSPSQEQDIHIPRNYLIERKILTASHRGLRQTQSLFNAMNTNDDPPEKTSSPTCSSFPVGKLPKYGIIMEDLSSSLFLKQPQCQYPEAPDITVKRNWRLSEPLALCEFSDSPQLCKDSSKSHLPPISEEPGEESLKGKRDDHEEARSRDPKCNLHLPQCPTLLFSLKSIEKIQDGAGQGDMFFQGLQAQTSNLEMVPLKSVTAQLCIPAAFRELAGKGDGSECFRAFDDLEKSEPPPIPVNVSMKPSSSRTDQTSFLYSLNNQNVWSPSAKNIHLVKSNDLVSGVKQIFLSQSSSQMLVSQHENLLPLPEHQCEHETPLMLHPTYMDEWVNEVVSQLLSQLKVHLKEEKKPRERNKSTSSESQDDTSTCYENTSYTRNQSNEDFTLKDVASDVFIDQTIELPDQHVVKPMDSESFHSYEFVNSGDEGTNDCNMVQNHMKGKGQEVIQNSLDQKTLPIETAGLISQRSHGCSSSGTGLDRSIPTQLRPSTNAHFQTHLTSCQAAQLTEDEHHMDEAVLQHAKKRQSLRQPLLGQMRQSLTLEVESRTKQIILETEDLHNSLLYLQQQTETPYMETENTSEQSQRFRRTRGFRVWCNQEVFEISRCLQDVIGQLEQQETQNIKLEVRTLVLRRINVLQLRTKRLIKVGLNLTFS